MKMYGDEPCADRAFACVAPVTWLPVAATAARVPPSSTPAATAMTRAIRFLGDSAEWLMGRNRMIFLEDRSGWSGQEPPTTYLEHMPERTFAHAYHSFW